MFIAVSIHTVNAIDLHKEKKQRVNHVFFYQKLAVYYKVESSKKLRNLQSLRQFITKFLKQLLFFLLLLH